MAALVLGALLLVASIGGCMHIVAVATGLPDPLDLVRPSASAVLDGFWTEADRQDAVKAVTEASKPYRHLTGVSVVDMQVGTDCSEGQNNWKVHEGYRLSCFVGGNLYFAWDGDFATGDKQFRALIESRCRDSSSAAQEGAPSLRAPLNREWENDGSVWECDGRSEEPVGFASGTSTDGSLDLEGTAGTTGRHISGPTAEQLGQALAGHDWLARMYFYQEFYRDVP